MEDRPLVTTKRYGGRREDSVVLNTTIDVEAVELLRQFCPPGRRATGKFLARLLYEHAARQEERQRLEERARVRRAGQQDSAMVSEEVTTVG